MPSPLDKKGSKIIIRMDIKDTPSIGLTGVRVDLSALVCGAARPE